MFRWITDTSFGQRLRLIRTARGFTQRELGVLLGYPESAADVRVAQYEKNARTPKEDTVLRMAEILNVSPSVFSRTICSSREDLMQSMYWLFLVKGGGDIYDCIDQFATSYMQLKTGEISPEEFLERMFVNQSPPSGSPEYWEGFFDSYKK